MNMKSDGMLGAQVPPPPPPPPLLLLLLPHASSPAGPSKPSQS
jgi:hypothetical protein